MAMDKVELEIVVDTSGADAGFERAADGVEKVGKKAADAQTFLEKFNKELKDRFTVTAGDVVNAIGSISNALGQIPDAIARGSQIDDISASFDDLAAKAGASGDALINGFSKALGDTVPKIDLMKQANELLNGGIDPSKFNELASAARSLSEVTGGSATDGLDKLSDALLRGRTAGLKAIGVVVDNEGAVKKYAESLGVTTEALAEEDKIEAIRIATLDALAKKRGELAVVEDDAADKIDQITANIQNQTDTMLRSIATNEDLVDVLDKLAGAVSDIQFGPLIQDLVTITGGVLSFTVAVGESAAKLATYAPIVQQAGDALAGLRDVVAKGAFLIRFFNTDGEKNQALVLNQLLKEMGVNFKGAGTAAGQFSGSANQAGDAQAKIAKATEDSIKRIKEAQAALDKQRASLDAKKKSDQDAAEAAKKALAEEKKRTEQIIAASEAITKLAIESDNYSAILDDLKTGTIDNQSAGERIAQLYSTTAKTVDDLASSQQILTSLLYAQSQGANVAAKDIAEWAQKVAEGKAAVEELTKAASGNSADAKSIFESISTSLLGDSAGARSAGETVGNIVLQGITSAITGGGAGIGETIGTAVGAGLAAYFSDGNAQAIAAGGEIGGWLGSLVETSFNTRDAQEQVRVALDKLFAEALKDNPLQAIIEGQLKEIRDLKFGLDSGAFADGTFDDAFQSLSATAQQAFTGIAEGFSEVFGQGSELASQLAAVLVNNLGGSLNNLQLLVEATGVSFDDLKKATVEAFLDGKLSALEAQSALNGIAQVSQKGIPDGVGLVSQAFDNLKAAGTKGGRALVDALQDIGFEAKELGQKDLSQVMATLAATGKYSTEEIKQVFDALKASGVNSVDDLTKATAEQLLPALSQLETVKFPFAEQVKDVRDYIDAVDSIPESKDVAINVKVNYASTADQKVVEGLSSGNRGATQGGATL